jgi:hypothetical protein
MKRSTMLLLMGIGAGVATCFLLREMARRSRLANLHLTTEDLDCPDLSAKDLASNHLIDLNNTDSEHLKGLGLDPESVDRLIENRPYRNKMELVSRMILTDAMYASIKERIGVSDARESFKVA